MDYVNKIKEHIKKEALTLTAMSKQIPVPESTLRDFLKKGKASKETMNKIKLFFDKDNNIEQKTEFIIEKNIPIPTDRRRIYPFDKMLIGDSFVLKGTQKLYRSAMIAANHYSKKSKTKFISKKITSDEYRIWRIQ